MTVATVGAVPRTFGRRLFTAVHGAIARAKDFVQTVQQTVVGVVADLLRTPVEAMKCLCRGLCAAALAVSRGAPREALSVVGRGLVGAVSRVLGGLADVFFRIVAGVGSLIGTVLGFESAGRGLSSTERLRLDALYEGAVDFDVIRVKRGGLASVGSSRTVGDTVYLAGDCFATSGELNERGWAVLVHEVAHAWQHQHGGGGYMHKAVWAQAVAALVHGTRNAAYEWRRMVAEGASFEALNPEAQAAAIEVLSWCALHGRPVDRAGDILDGPPLTVAEVAFLRRAQVLVRAGLGAA